MKKNRIQLKKPERLSFPKDEKKIQWLSLLLDTYHLADKGIYNGLKQNIKKGRVLACASGCSNCCATHTTIPVYPLEVVGLYWYVIEKISGKKRFQIKSQLKDFSIGKPCPFLVNDQCGVHRMRPMACRFFNVFTKSCAINEDPFYTRRNDVFTPDESAKNKAIAKMLPFHDILGKDQQERAIKNQILNKTIQNLHEIDWHSLSKRMNV
jgi:Fe-S-cluster containining protein